MSYKISKSNTALDKLSLNIDADLDDGLLLHQDFKSAGQAIDLINDTSQTVIVPYGNTEKDIKILKGLCSLENLTTSQLGYLKGLVKSLQRYTIAMQNPEEKGAVQYGNIYILSDDYYTSEKGLIEMPSTFIL